MVNLSSSGRASLKAVAEKAKHEPNFPSFVYSATNADGVIYSDAWGYKTFGDASSGQVDGDSVFWVCSQTKTLTHLAALHLIERGGLHTEAIVSDYIPQLANPIVLDDPLAAVPTFLPAKEPIRVKHLLSFTSGLFANDKETFPDQLGRPHRHSEEYYDKEDPLTHYFNLVKGDLPAVPLINEPDQNFYYGLSSDVLGFVLEKVTGVSLEEYLQTHIFKPLNLRHTSFYLTPEMKSKKVDLVFRLSDDKLVLWPDKVKYETDPARMKLVFGNNGLYTTANDWSALMRHLLQIHAGSAVNPIFKQSTIQSIFTPTLDPVAQESFANACKPFYPTIRKEGFQWSNTFGVSTEDWEGRRKAGSGWWSGWQNTFFFIDPNTGVAATFLTQTLPHNDPQASRFDVEFEKALYSGLE